MAVPFSLSVLPPFTLLYLGNGKVAVNKGKVVKANTGEIVNPTIDGSAMVDAWKEESRVLFVNSGETICLVVTHADKEAVSKCEVAEIQSASIIIGEAGSLASSTKAAITIGSVEYEGTALKRINQDLNSDAWLIIYGTMAI